MFLPTVIFTSANLFLLASNVVLLSPVNFALIKSLVIRLLIDVTVLSVVFAITSRFVILLISLTIFCAGVIVL